MRSAKTGFMKTQPTYTILRIRYNENTRTLASYAIRADFYRAENISPRIRFAEMILLAGENANSLSVETVCSVARISSSVSFTRVSEITCLDEDVYASFAKEVILDQLVNVRRTWRNIKAIDLCLCYPQEKYSSSLHR